MTPLRQRMIGDNAHSQSAATTQRSCVHYVAEFAKYFQRSPEHLDLEAVRQYQLYLVEERKLSPQSINSFVSAVQFLFLTTLEMPQWSKEDFPRARLDHKAPRRPRAPEEVQTFFGECDRSRKIAPSHCSPATAPDSASPRPLRSRSPTSIANGSCSASSTRQRR